MVAPAVGTIFRKPAVLQVTLGRIARIGFFGSRCELETASARTGPGGFTDASFCGRKCSAMSGAVRGMRNWNRRPLCT